MLENGQIIDFRGTFEEYRAAQERKRLQAAVLVKAEPEKPKKEKPRRPGGTKELEKQVADCEAKIEKLEEQVAQLEEQMATPEGASDMKLYEQHQQLKKQIAEAEEEWTLLLSELEEMK